MQPAACTLDLTACSPAGPGVGAAHTMPPQSQKVVKLCDRQHRPLLGVAQTDNNRNNHNHVHPAASLPYSGTNAARLGCFLR
jgi:hypothetical protein